MKKFGFIIIVIAFALIVAAPGCKTDEGFDITNGSWGMFLTSSTGAQMSMVYAFQGGQTNGDVNFNGVNVGTYSASRNHVIIHTEHEGSDGNIYIYDFDGMADGENKITGTFVLQSEGNENVTGTFEAIR
jgi:hypothetical protein